MPVVTFDGPAKIITEIAAGALNTIQVVDVYSDWKNWVAAGNAGYLPAFSVVGGDPISSVQNLGSTFFLENGWRLRPAELDHKLDIVGNLYTREEGGDPFVSTFGSFRVTVGLTVSNLTDASVSRLDLTQLMPEVWIDTQRGRSGTFDGIGTPTDPVDNVQDAKTIADRDRLRRYKLIGDIQLHEPHAQWSFDASGASRASLVYLQNQSVADSKFKNCILIGESEGAIEAERCGLRILSDVAGQFVECALFDTLSVQAGGIADFMSCVAQVEGSGHPVVDVSGALQVNFASFRGALEITNCQPGTLVMVGFESGRLILGPTNVGGHIVVSGLCAIEDRAGGTIVDRVDALDPRHVDELHMMRGLQLARPVTITPAQETAGGITLAIGGDGLTTSSLTRQ